MDKKQFSHPLDLKEVRITDGFWHTAQETVRREVIPYQWEALNDRVEGAVPSYCMHNFKAAGRIQREKRSKGNAYQPAAYTFRGFQSKPEDGQPADPDKFYGFVFQDTDFSKWIEAVGYSLIQHPDPLLEQTADEAIDIVCAAQDESGYLDTYYIINGMDRIFTNLKNHHELYCLGHLAEGAAAYYQATGKDKLLKAACRFADFVAEKFGPEPGKCKGYPGHEIAEMGLVRLYEVTGNKKYLSLSQFFLDQRGQQPYYFDEEARRLAELDGKPYQQDTNPDRYQYHQAHLPVREQNEAVGHAVRAGYLYSGMADMARLAGDEKMYAACKHLWESITREKLYITGSIGGTHHGEAFSYPFDLPNDTAYSETCAAISLAFFARRMLEIEPLSEYADVMEQALYNTVLAGMALDGKSFFYVNPLEVNPEACHKDARLSHVVSTRQKWLGCACCPPNLARIVSSAAAYAYTENQDTLWTHLYMGSSLTKKAGDTVLHLDMESGFPWKGTAKMTVHTDSPAECTLAFRIPGWSRCKDKKASVTAPDGIARTDRDGYCYLTGIWKDGDTVSLEFPMEIHMWMADRRVRENIGKVALTLGPVTYCMEEADNGKQLYLNCVDVSNFNKASVAETEIGGQKMFALEVPGLREETEDKGLYLEYSPAKTHPVTLKFIPYYAWANRGEGEMQVWVRTR